MNTGDLVTYPLFDSPGVSGRSLGWNPHGRRRVGLLVGVDGFDQFDINMREGDQVLDTGPFKVHVDPMSYQYVQDTMVDYVESFNYTGFHFDNPNAKRTCGCGSSFGV